MRCVAIVRFPAPSGLSADKLRAVLEEALPRYKGIPGLYRKYFLGNASFGGGVYEWESRAAAQAFYNEQWRERLRTVYGVLPQVEYFDVHAVIDNETGTARIDA